MAVVAKRAPLSPPSTVQRLMQRYSGVRPLTECPSCIRMPLTV